MSTNPAAEQSVGRLGIDITEEAVALAAQHDGDPHGGDRGHR